jgi:3-deoxy-D-manno-octulosonic-acid transferase
MARSLSLGAYLAFRRGGASDTAPIGTTRPQGPLIWAHCPDPERLPALAALSERLAAEGERLNMLVTLPMGGSGSGLRMVVQPVPQDTAAGARAFLDHWNPDLLLWMRGSFRPALLAEAAARPGIQARLLIEADGSMIRAEGADWLPGMTQAMVQRFDCALALDDVAGLRLRRMGMEERLVEVTGALDTIAGVLPCNERERRDLTQTMGSRPVWLAAGIDMSELPEVVAAHRYASRTAHRLLLILVMRLSDEGKAMTDALREAGLRFALRTEGSEPDEATQVYLVDSLAEMGLWYRLSPVVFMGGTLAEGSGGRHPFEAAALGSAVLHGPKTDPHGAAYLRLARAGASRSVRTGTDLGRAVEALLAPDKAAAMAHAAWDVTTAGADAGNRVIELIRDGLDKVGG